MTDQQLDLAIRIPGALFALNFLAVPAWFFWQSKRFEDLEKAMSAKFETQTQMLLRVAGSMDAA